MATRHDSSREPEREIVVEKRQKVVYLIHGKTFARRLYFLRRENIAREHTGHNKAEENFRENLRRF